MQNKQPKQKHKLHQATSVQVKGNHKHNPFSPISISTYYFVHAPIAKKQPNLINSHSAPPNLSATTFRSSKLKNTNTKQSVDNNNENNYNIPSDDCFVILDLPDSSHNGKKLSLLSPSLVY